MKCDVCHVEVEPQDDATRLSSIINGNPIEVLISGARHIRCSPSRAQYITDPAFGEPVVDNRPEYDKRLLPLYERRNREVEVTYAWQELQKEVLGRKSYDNKT